MRDKETGLTLKQLAFAKAYALDSNAGRAYLTAGYKSAGNERIQGYKLLQDDRILEVIAQSKAKIAIKADITRDEVLEHIKYGINKSTERNNLTALRGFIELAARMGGMLTDNVNTADITEQRNLRAEEKAEAQRIASIRLNEFAANKRVG
ncbi:MAG: terminase small subunit [Phycisphaerae bacterium]|nr:terminase small subunit [Phycisphaerae bacterium]